MLRHASFSLYEYDVSISVAAIRFQYRCGIQMQTRIE